MIKMEDREGFYWDFEEQDEGDFRMILTYYASNRVLKKLFKSTLKKLEKKHNVTVEGEEILEQFTIPDTLKSVMLPQIYRAAKKNIKYVINEVKKDGITVLQADVIDAYYNKINETKWEIKVFVIGQMK